MIPDWFKTFSNLATGNRNTFFIGHFLVLVHSNQIVRVELCSDLSSIADLVQNIWWKQKYCGPEVCWEHYCVMGALFGIICQLSSSLRHPLMKTLPILPTQVKIKGGNIGNLREKDAVLRNAGSVEPWELGLESFFANHSLLPQ